MLLEVHPICVCLSVCVLHFYDFHFLLPLRSFSILFLSHDEKFLFRFISEIVYLSSTPLHKDRLSGPFIMTFFKKSDFR